MNTLIRIRKAERHDADAVARLWLQFLHEQAALDPRFGVAGDALVRWRNDYPQWLRDRHRRLFVGELKGEIIGFVTAQWWSPPPVYAETTEVFVNELYVRPEARGQGAGGRLLAAVKAWAEELGADRLRLAVLAANEAGQAFWQHHDARPFSVTMTMELEKKASAASRASRRIGF
ncbi:GNAT family N-acetyltransferase [Rhodocaloribacter litoris]|uniref:GNAT family N-acetyltransferase n=1 Tax=Rhodocaloribacter litoris TaxID=2558931 RepID=UPI0014230713|nr:GNAT family N-acetyltransferase [Rhodocaloribacter litoris]QXD15263.1 GNAT family N-acetyltransferase [Rhodocaloribacter litoris]GIV62263.1 MAG: hypothetical protein KatS3mg044_1129 [Rhodothermaceae bacterium]